MTNNDDFESDDSGTIDEEELNNLVVSASKLKELELIYTKLKTTMQAEIDRLNKELDAEKKARTEAEATYKDVVRKAEPLIKKHQETAELATQNMQESLKREELSRKEANRLKQEHATQISMLQQQLAAEHARADTAVARTMSARQNSQKVQEEARRTGF